MVTAGYHSDYDEDQIVFLSQEESSVTDASDEDFVVLYSKTPTLIGNADHPVSRRRTSCDLSRQLSTLTVTETTKKASETNHNTSTLTVPSPKKRKGNKSKRRSPSPPPNAPSPSPIFDVVDDNTSVGDTVAYEEASIRISEYLANPQTKATDKSSKLALLHDLIVELGLLTYGTTLPASLTSAKAFLKTHAHINIAEYLKSRQFGQEALRAALYPSRSALVKSIRSNRIPLKVVKEKGLSVFLIHFIR